MKDKLSALMLVFFSLSLLLFSAEKVKEKDLSQRHQEFLNLTRYIILDEEKSVFNQLATDRERDIFIKAFWKQRDPTPGTPENEYKTEHIKKFNYANKFYGRGTPRPGWMTDMGRIHILMGEPVSKERFETTIGIRPVQAWFYYGDPKKRLPTHFAVVFFKRGGFGEFKLYDHVVDGPTALLVEGRDMDPADYETMYNKIRELSPTLSLISHSMIPGDFPFNFQPSPINNIIMAEIFDSPKRDVNPKYATNFLNYKGIVDTAYMTNFVESDSFTQIIRDPIMGIDFLHFSIAPKNLSVDYYEPKDQYYCNFSVSASLRIDEEIIFQYSKDFPFYFNPEDIDRVKANGVSIEDSFPVISGKYKFIVLLQNSVGKEFCLLEKEVVIPERTGVARIAGFLLGYNFKNYERQFHIPFKLKDKKVVIDPTNTFSARDNIVLFINIADVTRQLWEKGKVRINVTGLKPNNPAIKSLVIQLKDRPLEKTLVISHTIAGRELPPDYYEISASLYDETGAKFDEVKNKFIISQAEAVSHPISHTKAFSLANNFLYFYMLAHQYEKTNNFQKAESSYAKAYALRPNYKKGLVDYANFLYKVKKFDKILALITKIEGDENLKFEFFLLKGKAYMGKGSYKEAIDNFLQGNEIYNSDINLLNSLGFCYYKVADKKKALDALRSSLRLNPEQEDIKKLISELEKK